MKTAKIKKIKKFDIDDDAQRLEYESIMNNPNINILKELPAYDKSRENKMLVTVWWEECTRWELD